MTALNPVSLDITLRGLLEDCETESVLRALHRAYNVGDSQSMGYEYLPVMVELLAIPPTAPKLPILLSVWYNDGTGPQDDVIDVGLWNTARVPDSTESSTFAMGLTPWSELIDAAVYASDLDVVHRLCPTLPDILAAILWELTFYGFSDAAVSDTHAEIKQSMDEYLAGKADGLPCPSDEDEDINPALVGDD